MMDWKDVLSQLDVPQAPDDNENKGDDNSLSSAESVVREKLTVFYEKKGRGGKKATIITGFQCSDNELAEIAARLKKQLGVGGSSRDGEILIQGNAGAKVAPLLRSMGYKVTGAIN